MQHILDTDKQFQGIMAYHGKEAVYLAQNGFDDILMGYYSRITADLPSIGGPVVDPAEPIADVWDHAEEDLPPKGCMLGARRGDTWLGTGALRRLPGDKGELKRLFVWPDARGLGLGGKLATERISIAREMGLKTLLVDTLTTTKEMQALYASLGFIKIDFYPESATYIALPHLRDHMLFFRKDISE